MASPSRRATEGATEPPGGAGPLAPPPLWPVVQPFDGETPVQQGHRRLYWAINPLGHQHLAGAPLALPCDLGPQDAETLLTRCMKIGPGAREVRPPLRSTTESAADQQGWWLPYAWERRRFCLDYLLHLGVATASGAQPAMPEPMGYKNL